MKSVMQVTERCEESMHCQTANDHSRLLTWAKQVEGLAFCPAHSHWPMGPAHAMTGIDHRQLQSCTLLCGRVFAHFASCVTPYTCARH